MNSSDTFIYYLSFRKRVFGSAEPRGEVHRSKTDFAARGPGSGPGLFGDMSLSRFQTLHLPLQRVVQARGNGVERPSRERQQQAMATVRSRADATARRALDSNKHSQG